MTNIPINLTFSNRYIRVVTINGITKFLAADVCHALRYRNASKVVTACSLYKPEYISIKTKGGPQMCRIICYDEVMEIINRCQHRNANKLRKWLQDNMSFLAVIPGV